MKEVPFSIKRIRKGQLFCQTGIQTGKGLNLGADAPRIKLPRVSPHLSRQGQKFMVPPFKPKLLVREKNSFAVSADTWKT